jgi:GMP synthase-like glutamine amidotransferase
MRVCFLQHAQFEGLGAIEPWLRSHGHELSACRVYQEECFPPMTEFDWLVVMGGPMSVHDDDRYDWLPRERRFIEGAIREGKLVLGVCLGAQFVADALGAGVHRNNEPEIGWFVTRCTDEALHSKIFAGVPTEFVALHWHGDTFEIPEGAVLLAESDATAHQAFEAEGGRVVALQFHPEATAADVDALIAACADELIELPHVQSAEGLRAGVAEFGEGLEPLLDTILGGMERLGSR